MRLSLSHLSSRLDPSLNPEHLVASQLGGREGGEEPCYSVSAIESTRHTGNLAN